MKNKKNTEIFSVKLRALMSLKRCRGLDLAKKLNVRPATITGWRNAEYMPEREKWALLADCLGVTISELFGKNCVEENSDTIAEKNKVEESGTPYAGSEKKLYSQEEIFNVENPRLMEISEHFRFPGNSSDASVRKSIEEDLKYYLDEAERAGGLSLAAFKIRKYLTPEDFALLKERLKK